jgi:uncharacterized protein
VTSRELPIFQLGAVVYPGQTIGLCIFEDRYRALLDDVQETLEFGTSYLNTSEGRNPFNLRRTVGTIVQVLGVQPLADGKVLVAIEGQQRFQVQRWLDGAPYPQALVKEHPCTGKKVDAELLAATSTAVHGLRALHSELHLDDMLKKSCPIEGSDKAMVWQLMALAPLTTADQYRVLATSNPNRRMHLLQKLCAERFASYQQQVHQSPDNAEWLADF